MLARLFVLLALIWPHTAAAQRVSQPIHVAAERGGGDVRMNLGRPEPRGGMPRWVKWGLVGAAAGAVTMPILSGMSAPRDQARGGVVGDVAVGAVAGFVIIGGSILAWDAVCGGEKRSRRPVLCGR